MSNGDSSSNAPVTTVINDVMSHELTFHKNDKDLSRRYQSVRKAITICLTFYCVTSYAQHSSFPLDKLKVKSNPFRLSYIPAKSFTSLLHAGGDSASGYSSRISSVLGFYISQAEVTNREYRAFTQFVKDSLAHTLLQHYRAGGGIDWNKSIDWNDERLEPLWLPPEERFDGRKSLNPARLLYEIDFLGKKEWVPVYPDTLVWMSDFSYSYNEPLVKNYFAHAEYDNYPVVGVSLKQAMAFCQWKTGQVNGSLKQSSPGRYEVIVRLPTNTEWESAAFAERDTVDFVKGKQLYNCNFGPMTDQYGFVVKRHNDDGYFYTAPVKNFPPGTYGLYDMKGNVAEWTTTSREEIMNAEVRADKLRNTFAVKGGGWNSTPYYMQAGACQFYPVSAAHAYLGFRYVVYVIYQ